MIAAIRQNKLYSLLYAVSMGLIFRLCFGVIKNFVWSRAFDSIAFDVSTPKAKMLAVVLFANFITDLSSSLIAALLPGFLLFYVMRKSALRYSFPAILVFLALNFRLWRFWQAPDIAIGISALMGPFLSALVFLGVVWLFQKYFLKRMENNLSGIGRA
jgi:hypothetical protein